MGINSCSASRCTTLYAPSYTVGSGPQPFEFMISLICITCHELKLLTPSSTNLPAWCSSWTARNVGVSDDLVSGEWR